MLGGAVCAALVCATSFWAGMQFGQRLGRQEMTTLVGAELDPVTEQFSVDRLGEVSGRLVRLESEARALVKKISALETVEGALGDVRRGRTAVTPRTPVRGASGGRALAPARCGEPVSDDMSGAERLQQTERGLDCVQGLIRDIDAVAAQRSLVLMSMPTFAPVNGQMSSRFGNRLDPFTGSLAFHSGVDFPATPGTPIRAAGAGRVRTAGWMSDYGYTIEIDHGNDLITRYGHALRLHAKVGDLVTPGQLIAEVGSTGRSTGPHLHFEVLHQGRFVDPAFYLSIGARVPHV
ncbi:MAG: peptidase M23 [Candidatus Dactylopiibacterium carminicum]|uniref:M23 family peptidase n=1 Tax=Candidatus Dactylopiibacterium carminicum TaxID=857335 RepID=A0A272EP44_9RHOO|nr:M23 family peptidase [Candidatus Dactylopiibacterium carminicum]PAS91895.1 MAG: peptidase M23 [Candidatus Dactylopiibacterium carminicum]PAS94871.1 MAG: peptidase M23 [Candidatus Dactylopiibacterium carminicum]